MRYSDYDHMNNGWGLLMVLGAIGIWALVAVAVAALLRTPRGVVGTPEVPRQRPAASAEQILAERLARGEIDPEEYRTRMDALNAHRAT